MPCKTHTRFLSGFSSHKSKGFSLIELIVGIVLMAIAFGVISTLILPTAKQSAQQLHQIRAAELGQAMLNEILGKAFDENSDMVGGALRCGELALGANVCTNDNNLGAEENNRAFYDDVDDFDGLNVIASSDGDSLADNYKGFSLLVKVCNDANYDGICSTDNSNTHTAKLITVSVTTAQGYLIEFATYKANF